MYSALSPTIHSKPTFGIVTAMWQRHVLTDTIFYNISLLREKLASEMTLVPVVAGSEGDISRAIAEKNGFAYIEVENFPLGRKWNAALSLLKGTPIDGVIIMGSDDLLNETYFRMIADKWRQGEKLVGLLSMYFLDQCLGRMYFWPGYAPPRLGGTIGLGRFVHIDYVELLQWTLWDDEKLRDLDASMEARIASAAGERGWPTTISAIPSQGSGIMAIDVKSGENMWGYENIAHVATSTTLISAPQKILAEHFPPAVYQRLALPDNSMDIADIQSPAWNGVAIPSNVHKIPPFSLSIITSQLPFFEVSDFFYQQRYLTDMSTLVGGDVKLLYSHKGVLPTQAESRFFETTAFIEIPIAKRDMHRYFSSLEDVLFWIFPYCMSLGRLKSIVRALRRALPHARIVGDVRFGTATQKTTLFMLEHADILCADPHSQQIVTDKPLLPLSRLCIASHKETTPYSMRHHIAVPLPYYQRHLPDHADAIITAYMTSGAANSDVGLHFNGKFRLMLNHKNIAFYKTANPWVTGYFYRVCIIPSYVKNLSYIAALLSCGVPVIALRNTLADESLAERLGCIIVTSYAEAIEYAYILHNKQALWENTAQKIRDANGLFDSEKQVMDTLYFLSTMSPQRV